jgi:hypothetical protein
MFAMDISPVHDSSQISQTVERLEVEPVNAAKNRKPLYQARKKIFPKRAEGRFRRFKWIVMLLTLGIYYLTRPIKPSSSIWQAAASISSSSKYGRRNSSTSPDCLSWPVSASSW